MKLKALLAASLAFAGATAFLGPRGIAADKPEGSDRVFTDPKAAGMEYEIQGEYEGKVAGDLPLGAQVASIGKGKFKALFFMGGLPGAGWDGKVPQECIGALDGESARFAPEEGNGFKGNAAAGTLAGTTTDGKAFALKRVVRQSPTMGAKPPEGATVLFDGANLDQFDRGVLTKDKTIDVLPKETGAGPITKKPYTNFVMHLEFRIPYEPDKKAEERGNSGVYIQQRYEMQILDSFGVFPPKAPDCGGVYRQTAPSTNMCFPPLTWQTFDIEFTAPKWEGDKKTADARVTLKCNGVVVQDNVDIKNKTGAGKKEGPEALPILLQNHGHAVEFRNIWIQEK